LKACNRISLSSFKILRYVILDHGSTISGFGYCLKGNKETCELMANLNLAIDFFWKIFSTVVGYCLQYYETAKLEFYTTMIGIFQEYMFDNLGNIWADSGDNKILETFMGKFLTDEHNRWVDICLESSYQMSNSLSLRPLRSINISVFSEYIPSMFYSRNKASELIRFQFPRGHYAKMNICSIDWYDWYTDDNPF